MGYGRRTAGVSRLVGTPPTRWWSPHQPAYAGRSPGGRLRSHQPAYAGRSPGGRLRSHQPAYAGRSPSTWPRAASRLLLLLLVLADHPQVQVVLAAVLAGDALRLGRRPVVAHDEA